MHRASYGPRVGIVLAALATASAAAAGEATPPEAVDWPDDQQHRLAGRYAGTIDGADCDAMPATLSLTPGRRYALVARCPTANAKPVSLRGAWWVDYLAGSCLVLSAPGDEGYKLYGFRIDAGRNLMQDGSGCDSGEGTDAIHVLKPSPR